ncbi:unnamed protein product [Linum tenue]|uniref:Uncharacterized protein n=1 Tax=Linum tenue TaxID=586396 RepID=A0AAV0HVC8_9ROSI|nr:unnamed protein product [Linum tenue]
MDALLMALFEGKGLAKEAAKKKMYLAAAIVAQGGDSQLLLLGSIQGFFQESCSGVEVAVALIALYDAGVLEDEQILAFCSGTEISQWRRQGISDSERVFSRLLNGCRMLNLRQKRNDLQGVLSVVVIIYADVWTLESAVVFKNKVSFGFYGNITLVCAFCYFEILS